MVSRLDFDNDSAALLVTSATRADVTTSIIFDIGMAVLASTDEVVSDMSESMVSGVGLPVAGVTAVVDKFSKLVAAGSMIEIEATSSTSVELC